MFARCVLPKALGRIPFCAPRTDHKWAHASRMIRKSFVGSIRSAETQTNTPCAYQDITWNDEFLRNWWEQYIGFCKSLEDHNSRWFCSVRLNGLCYSETLLSYLECGSPSLVIERTFSCTVKGLLNFIYILGQLKAQNNAGWNSKKHFKEKIWWKKKMARFKPNHYTMVCLAIVLLVSS